MMHLPSRPERSESHLLPRSINGSNKSALLVENSDSLLTFLKRSLNDEGYAVRTATNSQEGLRLHHDCGPFNVVLINYCVPRSNGDEIDCCEPQTHGIDLAMAIRQSNPLQGIVIAAFDYRNAGEVPRPREVMHIPLLTDPRNSQLRTLLERIEVDRAIEALTSSELLQLQIFAYIRVRGLGRAARGRTWEDLLAEARLRTLIGTRHWNRDVDFVMHLKGAMQSISNSWKRQFREEEPYLISELPIRNTQGHEYSPLDDVISTHTTADQRLIDKDEEDRLIARFKDDLIATQVLLGLLDGHKKSEIMLMNGFDERKYASAVKRILKLLGRRKLG